MWYNQFKTVVLLASLSGLLMLLGGFLGGSTGVTVALVMSLGMNFFAYFYSDKMVLSMYNAQVLDKNTYAWIYQIIEELAQKYKIPMPKVYLINTPMANAFATGRSPQHASVAVTTGILSILNERELRGVLAHELSHVKNRDILVSTIAATIATAITYIANMMQFASLAAGSQDGERRRNPLVMLLLIILMPFAASLIQLAISRSREYMADESGAELCEDPLALASALEKLQTNIRYSHLDSNNPASETTAHLFIMKPFLNEGIAALFSSHPPTQLRVRKLQEMYQHMNHKH